MYLLHLDWCRIRPWQHAATGMRLQQRTPAFPQAPLCKDF